MPKQKFVDYNENIVGVTELPKFGRYTVDVRCREFRYIGEYNTPWWKWEFIPFDSEKGERMLTKLIKILPTDGRLFREIFEAVVG